MGTAGCDPGLPDGELWASGLWAGHVTRPDPDVCIVLGCHQWVDRHYYRCSKHRSRFISDPATRQTRWDIAMAQADPPTIAERLLVWYWFTVLGGADAFEELDPQ